MRRRARTSGRDAGAATLETTAMVALAGVLVAGVSVPFLTGTTALGDKVAWALCQVVTLGQGSCENPEAALRDRTPPRPCLVSSEGARLGGALSAAVSVGAGEQWLVEEMGDGTWRMTRGIDIEGGLPVGVGYNVGITVDGKQYALAAEAGAGIRASLAGGETWVVKSEEEARAVLGSDRYDDVADALAGDGGALRWLSDKVTGASAPPASDEQWVKLGVKADASARLSFAVVAGADANAQADIKGALGYVQRDDGTRTVYFEGSASASAAAGIWTVDDGDNQFAEAGLKGQMGAVVAVDYDDDGNATSVRMTSTLMGDLYAQDDGSANPRWTDRTMELPVETAADREVASRMLTQLGLGYVPGVTDQPRVRNPMTVVEDARDWAAAVHERGYVSDDVYTVKDRKDGLTVAGEMLVKVGVQGERVHAVRETVSQHYFDGMSMVERQGCAA